MWDWTKEGGDFAISGGKRGVKEIWYFCNLITYIFKKIIICKIFDKVIIYLQKLACEGFFFDESCGDIKTPHVLSH